MASPSLDYDDHDDSERDVKKPNLLSIIEEKYRAMNKKSMIHRMVCISQLRHSGQDPNYAGSEYKIFFREQQNLNQCEPITGLLLIYHQHLVHILETSKDILLKFVQFLYHSEHDRDGITSTSKILAVSHDISERLFSQWSFRALDIEAHNLDQYESSEDTFKIICDMLQQVYKLGVYLHRKPTLNLKNVLDYLYDHVPELLPQQAAIYFLLKEHDKSMILPKEYIRMYSTPFDLRLESEFVWPLDTDIFPFN